MRVPVMEEDVEIRKVARPVEEIEITKTQTRIPSRSTGRSGGRSLTSTTRLAIARTRGGEAESTGARSSVDSASQRCPK